MKPRAEGGSRSWRFLRAHVTTPQVLCFVGVGVAAGIGQETVGQRSPAVFWGLTAAFACTAAWAIWTDWGWHTRPWSIFVVAAWLTAAEVIDMRELTSDQSQVGAGLYVSAALSVGLLMSCWYELFGVPRFLGGVRRPGVDASDVTPRRSHQNP